jgi:hypothetical protein
MDGRESKENLKFVMARITKAKAGENLAMPRITIRDALLQYGNFDG